MSNATPSNTPSNTIFEKSKHGVRGVKLPETGIDYTSLSDVIPQDIIRKIAPVLPEVSELDAVRHFT